MNKNLVVFKGKKDGITVVLDDESSFEDLKDSLSTKVMDASNFFEGARLSVNFKGRKLNTAEESELMKIIANACNIDSKTFEKLSSGFEKRIRKKAQPEEPAEVIHEMQGRRLYAFEGMSVIHQGSLRSGQSIEYPGSVVIVGDINPGAEVVAEGSIAVFGSIKGMVHAGCYGDRSCFVTGIKIEPIQLRIADIITYVPQSYINKNRNKINPSYAYVQGEQIFIVPLV